MQIATCEVRLAGDVLNTVKKSGVTPAEVIILRAIHGLDAVVNVEVTGSDRRENMGEFNRLMESYKSARDDQEDLIVPKVFAGARMGAPLPAEFKEIGIDVYDGDVLPQKKENESEEVTLAREIYLQAVKDDDDRKLADAKKRVEARELDETIDRDPATAPGPGAWTPPAASQGQKAGKAE